VTAGVVVFVVVETTLLIGAAYIWLVLIDLGVQGSYGLDCLDTAQSTMY